MQSMKIERSERLAEKPSAIETDFGYGLRLHLEPSQVEKLGLENFKPGKKVRLEALAELVSLNTHKDGEGSRTTVSLQIMEMEAGPAPEANPTADALYGK